MGFRLDRTYVLEFEGAMEGAYVKIRATPVGVALEIRTAILGDGLDIRRAAELLAQYVQEWNLDGPDGETLPITAEAIVGDLEQVVVTKLIAEWYKAAMGVTAPLDPPKVQEAEIPMDPAA